MSEEEIRRVVREEIAAALKEHEEKIRLAVSKGGNLAQKVVDSRP